MQPEGAWTYVCQQFSAVTPTTHRDEREDSQSRQPAGQHLPFPFPLAQEDSVPIVGSAAKGQKEERMFVPGGKWTISVGVRVSYRDPQF